MKSGQGSYLEEFLRSKHSDKFSCIFFLKKANVGFYWYNTLFRSTDADLSYRRVMVTDTSTECGGPVVDVDVLKLDFTELNSF